VRADYPRSMPSRPRSRGRTASGRPVPGRPAPRAARATGRAAQGVALLVSFVLMAGIGGVLAAGLALPGVALANGAANLSVQAFEDLPTELNTTALPQKSVILASDGTQLATFFTENRVVVPLADIAPIMQKAVIATEDKRFYEHSGIDPQGMVRAAVKQVLNVGKEGASTLTQQYVKNVLIQAAQTIDDPVERQAALKAATEDEGTAGYARKLREAKLAITLEKRMTKDEILEAYLNIAQFGRKSIYGVESAAQYFFGKSAKDLNYIEAATIAGVTQSPSALDPELNPVDSQRRRNTVLSLMHDQGYITDAEYTAGVATPLASTLNIHPIKQGCMVANDAVPGSGFFCDYVTKVILNDPAFGAKQEDRQALLYKGGLTITTTLVPSEQAVAFQEVQNGVPIDDASGVASAIVSVEPGTGKITSMAENRNYTALQDAGEGETSVNYTTTSAYGGSSGFAPGSTFKPFTLVEWLKQGHSLSETFDGSKRPMNVKDFTACGGPAGASKVWTPGNSEGQGGVMNALAATRDSVNSAYLAMAMQLDLCNIMQDAADLGVVKAGGAKAGQNVDPYPSNVIGSDSVAPLAMAGAFASFAANGTYCTPIAITQVVDSDGKDLPIPSANCQEKLEPRIAAAVTYALQNVWKGTAKTVGTPSYPAAGKTGTTSENEENWFVGYTPLRATAVWVGYPQGFISMHKKTINGHTYYSGPYGSSIAAPTWKRFMDAVAATQQVPDFSPAGKKEIEGERVSVPDVVGMDQATATSKLKAAGFQVKVSSTKASDWHPAGTVVQQSVTGTASKNSVIILTLSDGTGQPPAPEQPAQPTADTGNGNGGNGNGNGGGWAGFGNGGVGNFSPPGR
jgi:membrane peptidoglycan carboxypeptidase